MKSKLPARMRGFMRVTAKYGEPARGLNVKTEAAGWIEVARVRPCEYVREDDVHIHYAKGNAQKLAAGWNLIEAIRTEDIVTMRRFQKQFMAFADGAAADRIVTALEDAFKTQPSDGGSDGEDKY